MLQLLCLTALPCPELADESHTVPGHPSPGMELHGKAGWHPPSAEPSVSSGSAGWDKRVHVLIIRGQAMVPELAEHLELLRAASRH